MPVRLLNDKRTTSERPKCPLGMNTSLAVSSLHFSSVALFVAIAPIGGSGGLYSINTFDSDGGIRSALPYSMLITKTGALLLSLPFINMFFHWPSVD